MPYLSCRCGLIKSGLTDTPQGTFSGLTVIRLNNVIDVSANTPLVTLFQNMLKPSGKKYAKMTSFLLRNFTTSEIRIILFNICVRPILEYNCVLFTVFHNFNLEESKSVQRVFTRLLLIRSLQIPYLERGSQLRIEALW